MCFHQQYLFSTLLIAHHQFSYHNLLNLTMVYNLDLIIFDQILEKQQLYLLLNKFIDSKIIASYFKIFACFRTKTLNF